MMGRNHGLSGALVGVATLPVVTALLHPDVSGMGLYIITATGAALLPDIDHPDSSVSRVLGPLTRVFAWFVARLSGGHRNGTHSYWGVANFALLSSAGAALYMHAPIDLAFGGGAWLLLAALGFAHGAWDQALGQAHGRRSGRSARSGRSPRSGSSSSRRTTRSRRAGPNPAVTFARGMAYLVLLGGFAMVCMLGGQVAGQWIIGIVMVLSMSAAVRLLKIRGWLDDIAPIPITIWLLHDHVDVTTVPVAITIGALVHIYGDMLTEGGCPLGWPGSQRMISFGLFRTNGYFEKHWMGKILTLGLVAAVAAVSVYMTP